MLQLSLIIKFDRRTKGGWVPLQQSAELSEKSCLHKRIVLAGGVLERMWENILSVRATKVSEIGQQALLGAEGVEESQGHKGLGIHRPLGPQSKIVIKAPQKQRSARILDWRLTLLTPLVGQLQEPCQRPG